MAAATYQGIIDAKIESGRVLDVDINTFTLSVATKYSKKPQSGISWMSPYSHHFNGEGIYVMPEVGSLCWLCFPSDGDRPFVLGWQPVSDEGDFRARRRDMNPGDIFLGGRDNNFIWLRRGGIVQIGAGPMCQRMFLPFSNIIKDYCENYLLQTLGGDLEWKVERDENTKDGKRPATLTVSAREMANDDAPIALVKVGSHGESDKTILSLIIRDNGKEDAAKAIYLTLDKEGNIKWESKKDVSWKSQGKFTVQADDDISLVSKKKVILTSDTSFEATGKQGVKIISSQGQIEVTASSQVKMGPKVVIGNAPQAVALAAPLVTWLSTHTHAVTSAPGTTSPPTVPPMQTSIAANTLQASNN